jgi:hypothetical protein
MIDRVEFVEERKAWIWIPMDGITPMQMQMLLPVCIACISRPALETENHGLSMDLQT